MYRIEHKELLASGIKLMEIQAPLVARKAQPGQFIILRVREDGERIPLTIADFDREKGTITIIFQEVGKTTKLLGQMNQGESIKDFVGPLGCASELEDGENVLCIGGGVGVAPLYPQVKYLHDKGKKVDVIIGAKTKDYVIFKDRMKGVCDNLYIATDDGSMGHHGFVSDVMKKLIEQQGRNYDRVIAIGPLIMMKVICDMTRKYGIKTTVSMNPIMVDGTGMCGGCRVTVGGETKYACVDGPDFDGHLIDFDEAMRRQSMYKAEERQCDGGGLCGGDHDDVK
ncbi:MAG: sulfide/dihydroorotate dehydrogenase-like FAD/NAD-binding protein [Clostridia bacterium]|nr:sulfide/dihydroorotate dehydrogenase-like FAD/NAD-binding protein [Clostridia bacterium]